MLSTKLCIMGAAALAVCKVVAAQTGAVVGEATIGTMENTFTIPADDWDGTSPAACTAVMAGCTGELITLKEETGGSITVIDDCTFRISQYSFTGNGPAVEWWASKQEGSPALFPYPANAIKVAELGEPGAYQAGMNAPGGAAEVIVRLGKAEDDSQILLSPDLNHISLWCEDYAVDFGNAALDCDAATPDVLMLEPEAAPPAGKPPAAGPEAGAEAEGEAKPEAEGEAKPEAEGAAKPEAEGAAKPEAEGAAKPEAEGAGTAETPAKAPAAEPIMAPEPEAELPSVTPASAPAPTVEETDEEVTDTTTDDTADETTERGTGDVASTTAEEASGAVGATQFVSAGALVAGAAVLLL